MKKGIENTAGGRGSEQKSRFTSPLIDLLQQCPLDAGTGAFAASPLGNPQVESRTIDLNEVILRQKEGTAEH